MTSTSPCRNFYNSNSGISFIFFEGGSNYKKLEIDGSPGEQKTPSYLMWIALTSPKPRWRFSRPFLSIGFLEQKLTDFLLIFRKLIPIRWTFFKFHVKKTLTTNKTRLFLKIAKKIWRLTFLLSRHHCELSNTGELLSSNNTRRGVSIAAPAERSASTK